METLSQTYLAESNENEGELQESEVQGLFGMFQVNLDNYIKVKFAFMYHMQIPPEQIDNWPYWEYEEYVELLSDVLKKKQNAEKGESNQQSSMDPSREAGKIMKNAKMPTPKMPSMPKFK
jgi:hypothetical protein